MSLHMPMQQQVPLTQAFGLAAPARYQSQRASGAEGFAEYAAQIDSESSHYADIPLDKIKTKKVKTKTIDAHGQVRETTEEVAICPECGETNCPCIARITVQARLDEENAKGVRNAERPRAISIVPQSFNQMSLNLEASNAARF